MKKIGIFILLLVTISSFGLILHRNVGASLTEVSRMQDDTHTPPASSPAETPDAPKTPQAVQTPQASPVKPQAPEAPLTSPKPPQTADPLTKIFEGMKKVNPGLKDYSAEFSLDLTARWGFLNYSPQMEGNYYFKNPDKHKVELTKAPSYLKKYPQVFGWHMPDPTGFNSKILRSDRIAGHPCWVVEMVPKQTSGDLLRQDLWVGKQDCMIYQQQYFYQRGADIVVDMIYEPVKRFKLFKQMTAAFEFPALKISAETKATYSKYKVNTGLPDSLFDK